MRSSISIEKLLGSWELLTHELISPDGQAKPTSDTLLGRLMYEASGGMSVLITLKNPVSNVADLIAYSGRFSVEDGAVLHHVEVASKNGRVGTTEKRLAELEGSTLTLKTESSSKGHHRIVWRKLH
jgi:hypothetical protein